jgi:hypothetical protein
MSNWHRWTDNPNTINWQFGNAEHPDRFTYPNLRDGSRFILASDYSGEHAHPEFRVLSFLLTTYDSVMTAWEPLRSAVRKRHLADGRRMSFKDLNDALRINAFPTFLDAASQLNGVLVCVGVDKAYSLPQDHLPPPQHDWAPDPLKKLLEICVFGGGFVDGLRGTGQNLHWITDDDAIVSTEKAKADAMNLMGGHLHEYPEERLEVALGIASMFDDDRRAEDLVAIPDLAAGAFSETLTTIGKANMPTSGSGPSGTALFLQIKSSLVNAWRSEAGKPLKHLNAVIRVAEGGGTLVSFGAPFVRMLRPDESVGGAPTLNSKWRRSLEAELKSRGIDPDEVLKSAAKTQASTWARGG